VTASSDQTARVWDVGSGKQISKLDGHTGRVVSAWFSADGQRIVTASDDHTARVWDASLENGSPAEIGEYVRSYMPFRIDNGQLVLAASTGNTK
jgi:WD40 repeat protein